MSLFTTAGRLLAAAGVLLAAVFRPSRSARTARALLRAFGIRWSVIGAPIGRGVLLAGNHVSWLDIVLMMAIATDAAHPSPTGPRVGPPGNASPGDGPRGNASPHIGPPGSAPSGDGPPGTASPRVGPRGNASPRASSGESDFAGGQAGVPMRLLGKYEVRRWPVIGRLAVASGTIFVDRAKPKSLPGTVAEVTAALRNGQTVQFFPEGTTTCGAHPAPWRPAFLQAAIDADVPVQRFTLMFSSPVAAFVDDETLLQSLWRVVRARGLSITVLMDEPVRASGPRRTLARRLTPARTSRPYATAASSPLR